MKPVRLCSRKTRSTNASTEFSVTRCASAITSPAVRCGGARLESRSTIRMREVTARQPPRAYKRSRSATEYSLLIECTKVALPSSASSSLTRCSSEADRLRKKTRGAAGADAAAEADEDKEDLGAGAINVEEEVEEEEDEEEEEKEDDDDEDEEDACAAGDGAQSAATRAAITRDVPRPGATIARPSSSSSSSSIDRSCASRPVSASIPDRCGALRAARKTAAALCDSQLCRHFKPPGDRPASAG
jgi:hypothetical protein